jgi:hypothetical protein
MINCIIVLVPYIFRFKFDNLKKKLTQNCKLPSNIKKILKKKKITANKN